jgi:hypothetical protein
VLFPSSVYGIGQRRNGGVGFGDRWVTIGCLLKRSERWKRPILINPYPNDEFFHAIINQFDTTGTLVVTPEPPSIFLSYCVSFSGPYCNTIRKWDGRSGNKIAYQFDGRSKASFKNCTSIEKMQILDAANELGYQAIDVGGIELSLEEKIDVMAGCDFFVGISSGMSVVAISIGMPVHIIYNDSIYDYQRKCIFGNKQNVVLHQNHVDFISCMKGQNARS